MESEAVLQRHIGILREINAPDSVIRVAEGVAAGPSAIEVKPGLWRSVVTSSIFLPEKKR